MADDQTTSPHPVFQPRPERLDIAVSHLLWVISGKTFLKPSGCWYYSGARSEGGYGVFEVRGKIYRVHRLVYLYCVADLPDDVLVLHGCDNPPCCNPDHLYAGDHQDNAIDCVKRGRNPAAILTEDHVRQIRELTSGPTRSPHKRLAERFGVSVAAIQDIVGRRKWRHVE